MIKKWMRKKLLALLNDTKNQDIELSLPIRSYESDSPRGDPVLNFKVYNAVGGKVVEFHAYDRKTDNSDNTIYIITDEEDFGTAIMNIAVTHRLRTGL